MTQPSGAGRVGDSSGRAEHDAATEGPGQLGMMDAIPIPVDGGLLEAERVDEEANKGARVARAQRGPDLRCRCDVAHASDHATGPSAQAWRFRNSSASQRLGAAPARARNSPAR